MIGKFELFKGKDGQFYFRLKAVNGENILSSEGYKAKASCQKGIASVRKNAPDENRYKRNTSDTGKFSFSLKAANGEIIGTSQIYKTEAGREKGIQSIMKNAPDASEEDLTKA